MKMIFFLKTVFRKTPVFAIIKLLRTKIFNLLFPKFDRIFCDITNICNLRCPHCYNNWKDDYLQKPLLMTMEHFIRILPFASLTAKGDFYLSCAFEPTLHPKFNDLLEKIPLARQKHIGFTTNLATTIADHTLETLSKTHLNFINISVESFNPAIYEQCRKNASFSRFINNLERLTHYFKKEPHSPRIRFITLVTTLNVQELPAIIQKCHTLYHAFENEIRYPWISPGPWNTSGNLEWFKKFSLPISDWESVAERVKHLPFRFFLSPPPRDCAVDQERQKTAMRILWIRPDGLLRYEHGKCHSSFHIDSLDKPLASLKKLINYSVRN